MSIVKKILRFLGIGRKGGVDDWLGHEVDVLWLEAKERFPYIIANIKEGIRTVESEDLSGGEKAVKVAINVMQTAPAVLQNLPEAKAFFVHAVTETFANGLDELRSEAGKLIGKL